MPPMAHDVYMGTIRFDEAWLKERGSALRAARDAAPQDDDSQDAVVMQHLQAAMAEHGIASTDDAAWSVLLDRLEHAAAGDAVKSAVCHRCSAPNGTGPGCLACAVRRRYDRVTQEAER